jgi:hypothetical protein
MGEGIEGAAWPAISMFDREPRRPCPGGKFRERVPVHSDIRAPDLTLRRCRRQLGVWWSRLRGGLCPETSLKLG